MTYTALEICNKALRLVGQMPLTQGEFEQLEVREDISENKIANAMVRQLYLGVKDEVLDLYNWKIALKHTKLTEYKIDNTHGFKYYFKLPLNTIRIISANGDFIRQGIYVYCNSKNPVISYVARIKEEDMNYRLVNLISLKLAEELCLCVLNDDDKLKTIQERFANSLRLSKDLDALEEHEAIKQDEDKDYSWLQARL